MKTYKFKLYRQKRTKHIDHQLWVACKVYNHCIALHKRYWKLYHKSLSKFTLQKHLAKLKKLPQYAFWNEIPSHAIQDITDRIHRGYKLFWENLKNKRKTAPPKFRSWRKYRSMSYNMVGKSVINGNTIKIAGRKYKFFKSRDVEGKIKLLTIKRDACGDYFVYLVCETPEVKSETRLGKSIGFDFGFKGKMLVAESSKDDIVAPGFFKKQKNAIAMANRKLSSKQRNAYHWQLARELCKKYSILCFEDLNMKFMQAGHGRKVMDYGFAEFLNLLEYVAPQFGSRVVRIDKWFPSSQLCFDCGLRNKEVKDLDIREWTCPVCGKHHNRDRNAAKNIHREGLRMLQQAT